MRNEIRFVLGLLVVAASSVAVPMAGADVVTDWNVRASDIAAAAKMPTPPTVRAMAIIQTAVYEAVNVGTKRYPGGLVTLAAAPGASIDAAVAAANRATLSQLVPSQQATIDSVYQAALSAVAESPAKADGIALGEKAAAAVIALRMDDGALAPESYRPHTTAGHYVPTVVPVASQWPQRKPWVMTSASQFRPAPPPSLTSKVWARDYAESKALGGKNSTQRTAEQTEMHPEYPCAHCIASAALGAVLQAEIGTGAMPTLSTTSPTAPGVVRHWTKISDFTQEVANARIYDGVHYRNSTEVGSAMGKQIGELVAAKYLRPGK